MIFAISRNVLIFPIILWKNAKNVLQEIKRAGRPAPDAAARSRTKAFFDLLTLGIGIAVTCIGRTKVNAFFSKIGGERPYRKASYPDAITLLSLGPSNYEFDGKDALMRQGVGTAGGRNRIFEEEIQRWTFTPEGIKDPARKIYAVE